MRFKKWSSSFWLGERDDNRLRQSRNRTPHRRNGDAAARIEQARTILVDRLLPLWRSADDEAWLRVAPSPLLEEHPRILIVTLSVGEPQLPRLERSIGEQDYPQERLRHIVIRDCPNQDAHQHLYSLFAATGFDIMVKLDADMVITRRTFFSEIARFFAASDCDMLQCALFDHYSRGPMQGVNAYRNIGEMFHRSTESLFTDRTTIPVRKRYVASSAFLDALEHAPEFTAEQAVRFGLHRASKLASALVTGNDSAMVQAHYLEGARRLFDESGSYRHGLIKLAFTIYFALENVRRIAGAPIFGTGTEAMAQIALHYDTGQAVSIEEGTKEFESALSWPELQRAQSAAYVAQSTGVHRVLVLLPHVRLFGGVLRFVELSRVLRAMGVDLTIAVPDERLAEVESAESRDIVDIGARRHLTVIGLRDALDVVWDAALFPDATDGLVALAPYVSAMRRIVYLIGGRAIQTRYREQIRLAQPDNIIGASSYVGAIFADLCPHVIPGGVDLDVFHVRESDEVAASEARIGGGKLRLAVPGGRDIARKRFGDALEVVQRLRLSGIDVELHAWTASRFRRDLPEHCVVHVGLRRSEVAEMLRHCDMALCPEADAGWNNPAAESLAVGLPLICTDAGTTDFAINTSTALIVEPGDVEGMHDSAISLIDSHSQRSELGGRGAMIMNGFSWEKTAAKLLDAIEATPVSPTIQASDNLAVLNAELRR